MISPLYLLPAGFFGYLVGLLVALLFVLRRVPRVRQATIELDATTDIITIRPPPLPADANTTINGLYIDDLLAQCKIGDKS